MGRSHEILKRRNNAHNEAKVTISEITPFPRYQRQIPVEGPLVYPVTDVTIQQLILESSITTSTKNYYI